MPTGETMLNAIDAEAGVRALAERAGVAVPHVHLARADGELVGGPFMISDFVAGETVPRRVLRLVAEHGIGELVAGQLGASRSAGCTPSTPTTSTVPLRTLDAEDPTGAALAALTEAVDALPQRAPGPRARAAVARSPPPDRRPSGSRSSTPTCATAT